MVDEAKESEAPSSESENQKRSHVSIEKSNDEGKKDQGDKTEYVMSGSSENDGEFSADNKDRDDEERSVMGYAKRLRKTAKKSGVDLSAKPF
jgi:hypothetical protein